MGEDILRKRLADFVIRGVGERSLLKLINSPGNTNFYN